MKQLKKTLLALTVIGLQACGGGGGGGGSTPPLSLDTVQGVYDTTTYSYCVTKITNQLPALFCAQHGHRSRLLASVWAMIHRSVEIELGTCRWAR